MYILLCVCTVRSMNRQCDVDGFGVDGVDVVDMIDTIWC